ncbi:MAG: hypothetical protein ACI91B_003277, partial [Planctomycetota bacterium]
MNCLAVDCTCARLDFQHMPASHRCLILRTLFVSLLLGGASVAQCTTRWLQGDIELQGDVFASTLWDPDGVGPLAERLVVGGNFQSLAIGNLHNLAMAEVTTLDWSSSGDLGLGANSHVFALSTMPNGDLVVGGIFSTIAGTSLSQIGRYDGTTWSGFGSGLGGGCNAFAFMPNGDMIAGGSFSTAGGQSASRIARWNGAAWSPLGSGFNNIVHSLAVLPNGDLIAGGEFTFSGSTAISRLARWNGSSWSQYAGGAGATVYALQAT